MKNQKLIYNDIIKGYSEIHLEKYGKVYFKHLTVEDSAGLEDTTDFYKSKAEGLGLPSEKEQLKILNEQGIWTDEEEQRRAELSSFVDGLRNSRKKLFLQKQSIISHHKNPNKMIHICWNINFGIYIWIFFFKFYR